jgi:hypothetical protein
MKRGSRLRNPVLVTTALVIGLGGLLTARQQTQAKPVPPAAPASRDAGPTAPVPAGTGAIAGTLVAADSGRAVRRARVTLFGGDVRTSKSMTTDDRGAFSFTALSAGEFTLSASKGGFLDVVYGQRRPGSGQSGTPIRLAAGQRIERLPLQIPRGGVITGAIMDEAGDPAFGVSVRAMRYVWRTGERALQQVGSGTTDDRGVYRIPALPPGEYIVSAVPRESQDAAVMVERMKVEEMAVAAQNSANPQVVADVKAAMARLSSALSDTAEVSSGYAPVYYPTTTQASAASTVTLAVSEEKTAIDLQLQIVPLATVSGSVISSQGPTPMAQLQLIDRTQPPGMGGRSARVSPDGTFSFTGVTPGQHTIVARASVQATVPKATPPGGSEGEMMLFMAAQKAAMAAASDQLWGMTDVVVDGRNVPNVSLSLQRGMSVSGSVAFEGGTAPAPAQLGRMSVIFTPAVSGGAGDMALQSQALIDADGRFTIRGVTPGAYRIAPSGGLPPGFAIKSAVFGGRDALDFPLEVKPGEDQAGGLLTFSTRTSDVSGTLQDGNSAPAPGYTVVVFSAEMRYWTPQARRVQATRPATDGRFSLRSLPAGDYRIAAVDEVEPGQWYDAAFLRQLVGASVAFTLGEGERKTQDLRIK